MLTIPNLGDRVRLTGSRDPEVADLVGREGTVTAGPIWVSRVMVEFDGTVGPCGGPRMHWVKAADLESVQGGAVSTPDLGAAEDYDDLPREEIGDRIRRAREAAGYPTQFAAARAAGIEPPNGYYHLEAGRRAPSFQTLHRLIALAGYDPAILFAPYVAPRGRRAQDLSFDERAHGGRGKKKPSPGPRNGD